jgi:uncharacterized protein (DUF2132 family)
MDPLHGVTLERMLVELVEEIGWEHMGYLVPINCFLIDPSIKSSLKFLRKTPWARAKVEKMYLERIVDFKKNPDNKY